jgi:hypothetical protein
MNTERPQNASRANGSKSRGPVTPAARRASSQNAITQEMLCTTIVLNGESRDRFLGLLTSLFEEFQPQTPFEESLIENMAVARWRQMRIWGMEKAAWSTKCTGKVKYRTRATWTHPSKPPPARPSPSALSVTIPARSNSSIVTNPVTTASTTALTGVLSKRATAAHPHPLQLKANRKLQFPKK